MTVEAKAFSMSSPAIAFSDPRRARLNCAFLSKELAALVLLTCFFLTTCRYDVLLECWAQMPSRRPAFAALVHILEDLQADQEESVLWSVNESRLI